MRRAVLALFVSLLAAVPLAPSSAAQSTPTASPGPSLAASVTPPTWPTGRVLFDTLQATYIYDWTRKRADDGSDRWYSIPRDEYDAFASGERLARNGVIAIEGGMDQPAEGYSLVWNTGGLNGVYHLKRLIDTLDPDSRVWLEAALRTVESAPGGPVIHDDTGSFGLESSNDGDIVRLTYGPPRTTIASAGSRFGIAQPARGGSVIVNDARSSRGIGVQNPAPGHVFVAIDVTYEASADDAPFSPLDWQVLADGERLGQLTVVASEAWQPVLDAGSLPSGATIRGWIMFEVPEPSARVTIGYLEDPPGGTASWTVDFACCR